MLLFFVIFKAADKLEVFGWVDEIFGGFDNIGFLVHVSLDFSIDSHN